MHLSNFFTGIAAKKLSQVESNPDASNQHEFNGVADFRRIFGTERKTFDAQFLYLGENEESAVYDEGFLTWYDARKKHPTRSEYRFYFPSTTVSEKAEAGDMVIIGKKPDGTVLVIIAQANSTSENQVLWLFGLQHEQESLLSHFSVKKFEDSEEREVDFASRIILEKLNIDTEEENEGFLEKLLAAFPNGFPSTKLFSVFARDTLGNFNAVEDPDQTLTALMNHEEILFRTLEKNIVGKRIDDGFSDVDDFVSFSLSVHNRRKARAGFAFENHLDYIFRENSIRFSRNKITENNSKPDFLFPGIAEYRDSDFPVDKLAMLGVKTTCKDRWRQILSEAQRISEKHLATLEPGISINQTDEMTSNNVQLVLPKSIHETYTEKQQQWVMNIRNFILFVKERED